MGGYGSGRAGWRPIAEESLAFPIAMLQNGIKKVLKSATYAPYSHGITWSMNGEPTGSCRYIIRHTDDGLCCTLVYQANGTLINDRIPLVSTPCTAGGARWWWQCPSCKRRAGVLYAPGRYWRCRHCHKITYQSSNESHKYDAMFKRWGVDPSVARLLQQRYA